MKTIWLVIALITLVLTACGGGGGGSSPASVTVTADQVILTGQAGWPGATAVSVTVDTVAVPLTAGSWMHTIDLNGATERTVRIEVIADGTTVAIRDVTVRR